jgi:hypothetical protein
MMADIKVRDNEYTQAANALGNISGKLASYMDEYCAALAYVSASAIQDTLITAALCDVSAKVLEIKSSVETTATNLQSECGNYVTQIDAADTYLY